MCHRSLLVLSIAITACAQTHVAREGPNDAGAATPPPDALGGSNEGGNPRSDGGSPDPARCEIQSDETVGDYCFCMGPVARYGDHVYRQALGLEIHDISTPLEPRLVRTIDEPPSSDGALVVANGYLVSLVQYEPEPIRIYDLSDPASPREVARFGDEATTSIATDGTDLLVATAGAGPEAGEVKRVTLDSDGQPRLQWRTPTGDHPLAIALGTDGAFVVTAHGALPDATLRWLSHDGVEQDALAIEVAGQPLFAVTPDALLLTGRELGLGRFVIQEGRLREDVTVSLPERARAPLLALDGTVVVGSPFRVFSLDSLDELPVDDPPPLPAEHLAPGPGNVVYASGGGGLTPVSLVCGGRSSNG